MIYYGFGLKDDALAVLDKSPSHPVVTLWKAYLKDDASLLNEVASASPALCFPLQDRNYFSTELGSVKEQQLEIQILSGS